MGILVEEDLAWLNVRLSMIIILIFVIIVFVSLISIRMDIPLTVIMSLENTSLEENHRQKSEDHERDNYYFCVRTILLMNVRWNHKGLLMWSIVLNNKASHCLSSCLSEFGDSVVFLLGVHWDSVLKSSLHISLELGNFLIFVSIADFTLKDPLSFHV